MILSPSDTAPPAMFLRGARAPAGGVAPVGSTGVTSEDVGTVVLKSQVRFDGTLVEDPADIGSEDVPFDEMPATGPFRVEADISIFKPEPDVVVVNDLRSILAAALFDAPPAGDLDPNDDAATAEAFQGHLAAAVYGTVAIDRGAGFAVPVALSYGWRSRLAGPRDGFAGDLTGPPDVSRYLETFDAEAHKLPIGYQNGFQNGAPLAGEALLSPGDRLRFDDGGSQTDLVIPDAPELAVLDDDGEALSPPLTLAPLVDTVIMDVAAATFTLLWRVSFAWDARFDAATLEVA